MSTKTAFGHHTLQSMDDCERKHYWAEVRGIQPIQVSPAIKGGRFIHKVIELYHTTMRESPAPFAEEAMRTAIEAAKEVEYIEGRGDLQPVEFDQMVKDCLPLLGQYPAWEAQQPLRVQGTEIEGAVEIPGFPQPYTFRLDAKVLDTSQATPRLWVLDFKTTTASFETAFQRFALDYQQTGYVRANPDCVGYVIRVIRRLKGRPNDPPPAEKLFRDTKFVVGPADLRVWEANRLRLIKEIKRHPKKQATWRQNPSACFSMKGNCPFYRLCRNPFTEGAALQAYYTTEAPTTVVVPLEEEE